MSKVQLLAELADAFFLLKCTLAEVQDLQQKLGTLEDIIRRLRAAVNEKEVNDGT